MSEVAIYLPLAVILLAIVAMAAIFVYDLIIKYIEYRRARKEYFEFLDDLERRRAER